MIRGKRGQEGGSNWFWIALIVGVIILVLLLFFGTDVFSTAKDQLFGRLGTSTVSVVAGSCKTICDTSLGPTFDYCCSLREVRFSKGANKIKATCDNSDLVRESGCNVECGGYCEAYTCGKRGGKLVLNTEDCKAGQVEITNYNKGIDGGDVTKTCSEQDGVIKSASCGESETEIKASDTLAVTPNNKFCCRIQTDKAKCCSV